MSNPSGRTQIILAVIGLVGALGAALIGNYDKLRGGGGREGMETSPSRISAERLQEQLRPIYYERGGNVLTTDNTATLDRYAVLLNRTPVRVVIRGHTNEVDPTSNIAVGEDAAFAVQRYLLSKGVDPALLDVVSLGAEETIKPAGSAYNERVEFKVLGH